MNRDSYIFKKDGELESIIVNDFAGLKTLLDRVNKPDKKIYISYWNETFHIRMWMGNDGDILGVEEVPSACKASLLLLL